MDAPVTTESLDLFACPACGADLQVGDEDLACAGSEPHRYSIEAGVPVLLTERDELGRRYLESYERITTEDLATPLEFDRGDRHRALVEFVRGVRAKRLLDIGTGTGAYLGQLDSITEVALDISLPVVQSIAARPGLTRVCADAQELPFKADTFDAVVLSDVLEHVLDAEAVTAEVRRVCTPDARVFVHVPWKEDIAIYADSDYEFTHLRSFNSYSFAVLWRNFYVLRRRANHPDLRDPIHFQVGDRLPALRSLLGYLYFWTDLGRREYELRARWIAELPRRERLLLRLYPPKFVMVELTPVENSKADRWRRAAGEWWRERRRGP